MENRVFLSIGSNMGDQLGNIKKALDLIKNRFTNVKVSGLYETFPLDYEKQAVFYNCCVSFKTELEPFELLKETQAMEKSLGQLKKEIRFGPRIIDLDIVFMGKKVLKKNKLVIPHERMHKRAFVLFPMLDLNKDFMHPVLKKTIKELADEKEIKSQGIKKLRGIK